MKGNSFVFRSYTLYFTCPFKSMYSKTRLSRIQLDQGFLSELGDVRVVHKSDKSDLHVSRIVTYIHTCI